MAAAKKNLIEVYVELLKLLECPVCYEYASSTPAAPIKVCLEGHFICGSCNKSLSSCPLCQSQFSNVRLRILDQMIEALAYPCCKVGCGAMLPLKDLHSHELQCNYQEEQFFKGHKNLIQSQNILKHVEEHYSSFYLKPVDDVTELGLCLNCLSVGLSDDQDDPLSRNLLGNQATNHHLSNSEGQENVNTAGGNVLQPSENNKGGLPLKIHAKKTKEIGIQCNLNIKCKENM